MNKRNKNKKTKKKKKQKKQRTQTRGRARGLRRKRTIMNHNQLKNEGIRKNNQNEEKSKYNYEE